MKEKTINKTSSTVLLVMIITFVARFFGLFREVLVARYYGASIYTDAYIIANNIPTVLFDMIGQALLTSFIPMYSRIRQEKSVERANGFTIHLVSITIGICMILVVLGEIYAEKVVFVFASGYKGTVLDMTVEFSRILLPSLLSMTLVNLFTGYLQIYQKFIFPAVVPVIGNLIIICSLMISHYFDNIYFFVWGSLLGLLGQVAFLFPCVKKIGLFKGRLKIFEYDEYVLKLIPILIPVIIGSAVSEVNAIIDRTMVSGLETGTVSTLNYAYKIVSLVISVVITPLIAYMYPQFSAIAAKKEMDSYKKIVHKCINIMLAVIIPVMIFVFSFREIIIKVLFERGNFDSLATMNTSNALACYAIGIIPIAIQQLLIRILYAEQNTVIPMFNGIICAIVNVILNYILIRKFSFIGSALSTSIVASLACIILIIALRIKGIISFKIIMNYIIKNSIAGGIMGIFVIVTFNNILSKSSLGIRYFCILIILLVISLVLYLFIEKMLRNDELTEQIEKIVKKRKHLI